MLLQPLLWISHAHTHAPRNGRRRGRRGRRRRSRAQSTHSPFLFVRVCPRMKRERNYPTFLFLFPFIQIFPRFFILTSIKWNCFYERIKILIETSGEGVSNSVAPFKLLSRGLLIFFSYCSGRNCSVHGKWFLPADRQNLRKTFCRLHVNRKDVHFLPPPCNPS